MQISHDNFSIVLIKPDGLKKPEFLNRLDLCIREKKLIVLERAQVNLTRSNILAIWPEFQLDNQLIMRELYCLYMTSGPCDALLVAGEAAVAKTVEIKKALRRISEICAFENAIHTPDNASEAAGNAAVLFPAQLPQATADGKVPEKKGLFGRALALSSDEIRQICTRLWQEKEKHGWPAIFSPAEQGAFRVCLFPGDPNPVDYGISVLYELCKNKSIEDVIALYIESEVNGRAIVMSGSERDTAAMCLELVSAGLLAEVVAGG
jgi:nucleoside diphosphate kinase